MKSMAYGKDGYLWINDMQPKMIMHPKQPQLDGTDLSEYKDPKGKRLFVEFVKVCKEKGEGTVEYMWPKPGATRPCPQDLLRQSVRAVGLDHRHGRLPGPDCR